MTSAPIRDPLAGHLNTPQVRGAWRMGRAQGGASTSLLVRDQDGMLAEFVEISGGTA
jgi:hypothetical protein